MSRGLGKLQKQILKYLECSGPRPLRWLASDMFDAYDYGSEYTSVSRAITSLEKRGLVRKRWLTSKEEADWGVKTPIGFRPKIVELV